MLKKDIAKVAREKLGFESLRPGQEEAVRSILDGRDTLVVQPTGSGKSAIYQIAGLMIEGSTVVISPLIALQKDQVDSIGEMNAADAVAVNSAQSAADLRDRMQRVEKGKVEYIFLAPEQLRKPETLERLERSRVSLFVVDEAHCVSEWGHNFRPDYLGLGRVIESLGHPGVLALTATAASRVRDEIVERLGMQRPNVFVQSFDRPNIYLRVDRFKTETEKRAALLHRARWADKPGIVYVGTRKAAEAIMRALAEEGIETVFYHGGLRPKDREIIQERFMNGEAGIIVATNAFGMGVDKPDIRFVYHYDPSDSLDAYYQEIGRAGRDGAKSEAVLFYRREDIGAQRFKTGEGKLDAEQLEELAERIAQEGRPVHVDELADGGALSKRKLTTALNRLEDSGAAKVLATGEVEVLEDANLPEAARAAAEEQERRREAKRERLDQMEAYAETSGCRRELLLQYFGDPFTGPCGFCDNCAGDGGEGTRREV